MKFLSDRGSLKYKLAISHISMIIIPIVLVVLTQWIWSALDSFQDYSPEEQKGIFQPVNQVLEYSGVLSQIQQLGEERPDMIMSPENLARFDELAGQGLILAVLKDNQVVYKPPGLNLEPAGNASNPLTEWLTGPEEGGNPLESRSYMAIPFQNLSFSDGSTGQINIMAAKPQRQPNNARETALLAVFGFALLISVLISYRVANQIIKPVRLLNQATGEISRGNLDHTIEYTSNDEIGELCSSFETMRHRLNEAEVLNQRYEKNRRELLANISHDLKTPITSIRGYVQGIQDGVANTPEKLMKYTRTIFTNAMEMDRLIDDLFLFSRLDLKQLGFDFHPVDIRQYMLDCVEDKSFELEQKGIKLSFEDAYASQQPVMADGQRLKRVISNILVNAEQYRDPAADQATIDMRLSETPAEAIISISDNGRGISADVLPHIFERTYRGEAARSRPSGGAGLGLAIAQQIVEAHGGRIWAESPEGAGTAIFFSLPKFQGFGTDNVGSDGKEPA